MKFKNVKWFIGMMSGVGTLANASILSEIMAKKVCECDFSATACNSASSPPSVVTFSFSASASDTCSSKWDGVEVKGEYDDGSGGARQDVKGKLDNCMDGVEADIDLHNVSVITPCPLD